MKTPNHKKQKRVAMLREIREAQHPVCPNCGKRGSHFVPPHSYLLPYSKEVIRVAGEYICEKAP